MVKYSTKTYGKIAKSKVLKVKKTIKKKPIKKKASTKTKRSLSKNIIIIGRKTCPYCVHAEKLVRQHPKLTLKKYVSTENMDYEMFQKLKKTIKTTKTIPNTIPIIIENGKYLGGFSELFQKYSK